MATVLTRSDTGFDHLNGHAPRTAPLRSLQFKDLALMIIHRRWLIVGLFAAIFSAVAVASWLTPAVYLAKAKLLLKVERTQAIFSPTEEVNAFLKPMLSPEFLNSEVEILESNWLVREVVLNTGMKVRFPPAPGEVVNDEQYLLRLVSQMESSLRIKAVPGSNIISVSFESNDPRWTAEVVNTLCRLYVDRHLEIHETRGMHDFFLRQAEALHDTLQNAAEALRQFESERGVVAPQKQRELALQQLSQYEAELNAARAGAREAELQISFLEKQIATEPARLQSQARKVYGGLLQNLKVELDSLRQEYMTSAQGRGAAGLDGDTHPSDLRSMKASIAQLEETVYREELAPPPDLGSDINKSMMELNTELTRARNRFIAYRSREKELGRTAAELDEKLRALEEDNITYETLQREWQMHQNNYLLYAKKQEEARITQALDSEKIANVTIIDPATAPLRPIRPNHKLNLAMGFLLAMFVSVGIALGLGYFDNFIRTSNDIERLCNVPVIVAIPEGQRLPRTLLEPVNKP